MTEKERNERFTKQALSHKDWNGRAIEGETTAEIQNLPKINSLVVIPDNIDSTVTKAFASKPVFKKANHVSAFANAPVTNAMSGF